METDNLTQNSYQSKKKVNLQAKCSQNNDSTLSCNNPNCKQFAFVCNSKICECRVPHKKCLFTCTDQIIDLIEQKRSQSNIVIDQVCSVLDKWIDQISKTRQKIQDILIDWGLSGPQKKFIQLIKNNEYKQLTGNHINQITTQTTQYFQKQIKQKLIQQIQNTGKIYFTEIKIILKTFQSLFNKVKIQEKQQSFQNTPKEFIVEKDFNFINDFKEYTLMQKKMSEENINRKVTRQDFDQFVCFVKNTLEKDFKLKMQRYKKQRRNYGSQQLREKYFQDYMFSLMKFQQTLNKWKQQTEEKIKYLNRIMEPDLQALSKFWIDLQGQIQRPFTTQMALSFHRTINAIFLLIDYIKQNGPRMNYLLVQNNRYFSQKSILAIYFLDGLMDTHPQIDEVDILWSIVRFQQKLKGQVNLLFQTIESARKQKYTLQLPLN